MIKRFGESLTTLLQLEELATDLQLKKKIIIAISCNYMSICMQILHLLNFDKTNIL